MEVNNKRIIFVCGKICSGKNTFCEKLGEHHHIQVSDIVKKLSGEVNRAKLQETADLDILIADELLQQIYAHDKVSIDGIRQVSILKYLIDQLESNDWEIVWLEVEMEELKRRYITRNDPKDKDITIEDALLRDEKLGMLELETYLKSLHTTFVHELDNNS